MPNQSPGTGESGHRFCHHPFWQAGFRPFFALALVAGMVLPGLWVFVILGADLPRGAHPLPGVVWHAHEMFYGFGGAALAGFLLTASKNWVNVRGWHGTPLILLTGAWILERGVMALALLGWLSLSTDSVAGWLGFLGTQLFLPGAVVLVLTTLLGHRGADSYRADNRWFLVALPLFLPAKALLLSDTGFAEGVALTLALYRLVFLIMLERTLRPFMKGALGIVLPQRAGVDQGIKALALVLVLMLAGLALLRPWAGAAPLGFATLGAAVAVALGLLLLARLVTWSPLAACRRIDLGIMFWGYLLLSLQVLASGLVHWLPWPWLGALLTHSFTLGVMGSVIPAMVLRIAQGHTGRKVAFSPGDRWVLRTLIAATLVRVVLPALWPGAYATWLALAALLWAGAFAWLLVRYLPYLWQARVDGKAH